MNIIEKNLVTGWMFHQGEVVERMFPDYGRNEWSPVTIPHSWNDKDTFIPSRGYYRGIGWYKCNIEINEEMLLNDILVDFGAVYGSAEIWINGIYKGFYLSGYTGFRVDITREVRAGTENQLVVRASNKHDPAVLPGREEPDYNLYGGIYREVKLVVASKTRIEWQGIGIRVNEVLQESAEVEFNVDLLNDNRKVFKVQVGVRGMDGQLAAAGELTADSYKKYSGLIDIPNARLWSPDDPYLYSATIELIDKAGNKLYAEEATFGVRTFRFDSEKGFFLNGKPMKLNGVNRHQCYPGLGNAVPASLQIEDAKLIKEMGCNFVRASHYPQHVAFLDACDRLGILVYEEIASWQSIESDEFKKSAIQMLKEMIRRDRNHPSIIIWGIMNEGRDREFFIEMNDLAKEMDPDRVTCYAENRLIDGQGKHEDGRSLGTISVPDVLGVNYQLEMLEEFHRLYPNLQLLVAEYSNGCTPRNNIAGMERQLQQISKDLEIIESLEFVAGGALWSMHDYGSDYEFAWPIQDSGIVDAYRIPKYTYHYFSSHWRPEPQVYIAGHWTHPGDEGSVKNVIVINNCSEVELFINGETIGIKSGEILRFEVGYQPGIIQAIGIKNGVKVECTVATAGMPSRIQLTASIDTIPANNSEVSVLTAEVVDEKGIRIPDAEMKLDVIMDKPLGEFYGIGGEDRIIIQSGIGRIVFRTGLVPGKVIFSAEGKDLKSNECIVELYKAEGSKESNATDEPSSLGEEGLHQGQWQFSS